MLRKLRGALCVLTGGNPWEAHYDYCAAVILDGEWGALTGWPCSEGCANHPGSKGLVNRYTGRCWYP